MQRQPGRSPQQRSVSTVSKSLHSRRVNRAICVLGFKRKARIFFYIYMFLVLFFILLVIWILGWVAFHVAGGLIHLLLVFALISLVLHFFRGSRTA